MAARQNRILTAGATAPQHRLQQLGGGESLLFEPGGGPVLLVFFKVTCPVCQLTLPYLNRLHRAGAMTIRGISQNSPEDTREFNQEFGIEFPVLLDRESEGYPASNDYGISSVPSQFLIGADGRITRVIEGWRKREMEGMGIQVEASLPEWKAG